MRSAQDVLQQSIELAVAAEELGADGAYFRVHHFARQLPKAGSMLPKQGHPRSPVPGPQDISFSGRGNAIVAIGWGGDPALRPSLGEAANTAGSLIQLQPTGTWRVVADVSAFEAATNPAGGVIDSNPYGVLAESGRTFVTDAGGNSLLEVAPTGAISLVSTFPTTSAPPPFNQSEAVPTRVKRGPDGALYH